MSFEDVRSWYEGYEMPGGKSLYNSYSVMAAVSEGKCRSFWGKTSAAESMERYISMDFEGLQGTVARLISGEKVPVDTSLYENDFETLSTRDDVLTLLIHLGYLTYDAEMKAAHIPNEEVRDEFRKFLKKERFYGPWIEMMN